MVELAEAKEAALNAGARVANLMRQLEDAKYNRDLADKRVRDLDSKVADIVLESLRASSQAPST